MPITEKYQYGKSGHMFFDEWRKHYDEYIGMLQLVFMDKNYDEICNACDEVVDEDIYVYSYQNFLCVIPDGYKKLAFPINCFYALALPASVEGFVDDGFDKTKYEDVLGNCKPFEGPFSEKNTNLEYIFIECEKEEYQHEDLLEMIMKEIPDVTILYKGEFEIIGGVYIPINNDAKEVVHVYDQEVATAKYFTGEVNENGIEFYYSCACCGNYNEDTFYMPADYHTPIVDKDNKPVYNDQIVCGMNHTSYQCAICGEEIEVDIYMAHETINNSWPRYCQYCGKNLDDTLTIALIGGGVIETKTIYVENGTYYLSEPDYDKEKYEFLGWYRKDLPEDSYYGYHKYDESKPVSYFKDSNSSNNYVSLYALFKTINPTGEYHNINLTCYCLSNLVTCPTQAKAGELVTIEIEQYQNYEQWISAGYDLYMISPNQFIMPDKDVTVSISIYKPYDYVFTISNADDNRFIDVSTENMYYYDGETLKEFFVYESRSNEERDGFGYLTSYIYSVAGEIPRKITINRDTITNGVIIQQKEGKDPVYEKAYEILEILDEQIVDEKIVYGVKYEYSYDSSFKKEYVTISLYNQETEAYEYYAKGKITYKYDYSSEIDNIVFDNGVTLIYSDIIDGCLKESFFQDYDIVSLVLKDNKED